VFGQWCFTEDNDGSVANDRQDLKQQLDKDKVLENDCKPKNSDE